jgi:hypothetical protein
MKKYPDASINSILVDLTHGDPGEISLDKIRPERRELDKIIMGDVLGLTDEEQLEVYRAVVDLVKARINKAKSVENNGKTGDGIDMGILKETIVKRISGEEV